MNSDSMEQTALTRETVSVWKSCLSKIKDNVTQMTYNTWFLPIKPLEFSNSTLKVELPSQFFWEWIDEHYNALIRNTINDVIGQDAKLEYVIVERSEEHTSELQSH